MAKLTAGNTMLNMVCVEEENVQLWQVLNDIWMNVPTEEKIVLAGDFNGHIGVGNIYVIERIHSGLGSGDLIGYLIS